MQVSSYYASVGIDFDVNSLKRAQTYMKRIEKTLNGFKARTEKQTNIQLNVKINRAQMMKAMNTDLARLSKSIVMPINRFSINQKGLQRAVEKATATARGGVRLGAVLSAGSLQYMRQQIRHALSNVVINPTINPRVRQPRGQGAGGNGHAGGGGGVRVRSPNHNPMMIGGAAGSLMRFGPYALPFVAGAYGLNSMSNSAQTFQSQGNMLRGVVGSDGKPGSMPEDYEKYLGGLADRYGMRQRDLTPGFSQMMAGSIGTGFEPHLLEGFKNLTQYGATMNLGPEEMKLSIKAFTQMIGKQQIMAEELKGQAAEHLPSVVRLMAKAVTGGDTKALFKMMEDGKLDPNIHLPKLFDLMKAESDPMLNDYFKSITYNKGNTSRQQEKWQKSFFDNGGTNAVSSMWSTLGNVSERAGITAPGLGKLSERLSNLLQAGMLIGPETLEYGAGKEGKGNYLSSMFGASADNNGLNQMKQLIQSNWNLIGALGGLTAKIGGFLGTQVAKVAPVAGFLATQSMKGGVKTNDAMTNILNTGGTVANWGAIANAANPLKANPLGFIGSLLGKSFGSGATADTKPALPNTRESAANKIMNGTGQLDKLPGGSINPTANVTVTNNMTFNVANQDSAKAAADAVKRSSDEAFQNTFKSTYQLFPKIAQ